MNDDIRDVSDFNDDLTTSSTSYTISNATTSGIGLGSLVYSTTSSGWNTIGQAVFDVENLSDMFIVMMKDLSEDQIISILNSIKERQPLNYKHCLINLIAYPNLKLMSEEFLIDRYEDIKDAMTNTHTKLDFTMVYGKLLDQLPAFKLLIELKK